MNECILVTNVREPKPISIQDVQEADPPAENVLPTIEPLEPSEQLAAVEHRRKQRNALIRTHVHSSRNADAKPEITFSRSLAATRITVPH